jgi:hypothetical protein
MKMDSKRLALLVEASEHLEWMREQMEYGRLDVLDAETSVLVAVSAIRQVDLVAPVYGNFSPAVKHPLVRSCIIFRCWERHHSLPNKTIRRLHCL